ncbi:MAG: lysophospholipid acyltransferase family protein [Vicinamibacterales bacterium]
MSPSSPDPRASQTSADPAALVEAIVGFLTSRDLLAAADIRAVLAREIAEAGPAALVTLKARLAEDAGWEYYPRDPLAQRIHHLLADRYLSADSAVEGAGRLSGFDTAPLAILANHLSYADANAVEVLLQRAGAGAIADRLTAIAGPKVFTSRERRFSSLCFGAIKVPQSAEVSSEEAVLNPREVARAARRAIDIAHGRLHAGDALLIFAEGTRSRAATMQPMLSGVARYLEVPGTWVVPVGLTGTETLFPVDGSALQPGRVTLRVGAPFPADALLSAAGGDRRLAMDAAGLAIAGLLPAHYRGVYRDGGEYADARAVLASVTGDGMGPSNR